MLEQAGVDPSEAIKYELDHFVPLALGRHPRAPTRDGSRQVDGRRGIVAPEGWAYPAAGAYRPPVGCVVASRRLSIGMLTATKRTLRALAKAADLCAADPARVARTLAERAFLQKEAFYTQALRDLSYRPWREFDIADSLRFFALRMRGAGLVKSEPHKLVAQGTELRFIVELKRELKGRG